MRKLLLSLGFLAALTLDAGAATVTIVKSLSVQPPVNTQSGNVGEVLQQTTTVAAFTTAQNVATLFLNTGEWSCSGTVYSGTTTGTTLTAGISTVSATLPVNTTLQFAGTSASLVPTGTSGNVVVPPVPVIVTAPSTAVYLVASHASSNTATAGLTCMHVR